MVTAASTTAQAMATGQLWLVDSGTQTKIGACTFVNSTNLWLTAATGGDITGTNPHTWAVNDIIRGFIIYEAA